MKTFLLGFFTAFVVMPVAAVGYFRLGLAGVQSDAEPPAWESQLIRSAVHASVRRSTATIQAPPQDNADEAMVQGGKLYFMGCAGCHGEPGKSGEDLDHYPRVPQLPRTGTQYSEPQVYWIVKHGIRHTAMSAYGPFYSEKDMWAIASFLRRINNLPPGMLERIQSKQTPDGSSK